MKPDDTQSIALEVKGISSALDNLKLLRDAHETRSSERSDAMDVEIKSINLHIAADREFKRQLIEDVKELKESVKILTEMSHRVQGGWWAITAMSTIFSILGSGLTLIGYKLFK